MRKRVLLFAIPLCVVAIAAGVAAAAPSDAEHSRGPKLDKLHAERPTAASHRLASVGDDLGVWYEREATAFRNFVTQQQVNDYLHATRVAVDAYLHSMRVAVDAYLASVAAANQAAADAQAASAPRRVENSVSYSSNPGDFLSCVRQRESGGNYGIYNSGGSGAAGAYQFMPGTWNGIASSSGRPDLVGVDPAQAAPADQDAMAQALYAQQGAAPWGGGC
jgi:hypothetical protein